MQGPDVKNNEHKHLVASSRGLRNESRRWDLMGAQRGGPECAATSALARMSYSMSAQRGGSNLRR